VKLAVSQGQSFQKMTGGLCGDVRVKLDTATRNFAARKQKACCSHVLVVCEWLIILFISVKLIQPVPVAARSKALVYGRSPAEILGSSPTGGMDVCCGCCVLSGRGLCEALITPPEESYRL
jgi:hypothetical protein